MRAVAFVVASAASCWLTLAASGCATAPPYHSCVDPCGSGQACDTTVGQCHADPCEGTCNRGERCESGPPPHCEIVPLSEMDISRPDTSSPAGSLH